VTQNYFICWYFNMRQTCFRSFTGVYWHLPLRTCYYRLFLVANCRQGGSDSPIHPTKYSIMARSNEIIWKIYGKTLGSNEGDQTVIYLMTPRQSTSHFFLWISDKDKQSRFKPVNKWNPVICMCFKNKFHAKLFNATFSNYIYSKIDCN